LPAAVLAVTTAACRGGGADKQATATTTGQRDATANDIDINPVSRDELRDGGTLRCRSWHRRRTSTPGSSTAPRPRALLPSMFGFDSEARTRQRV
jgi:hypothetical protein